MTYAIIDLVFLALSAIVAAVAVATRPVRGRLGAAVLAVGLTLAALLVLTAVFDTLIIAAGIVAYDDELISGARILLAPIEDFAYPFAAVLLLPSLWTLFGRGETARGRRGTRSAGPGSVP